MPALVQTLFDGNLDIVGDVHGEIDALLALLKHLGYSTDGSHREGRRLVFLGDLTDRGPDSPAVLDLAERLVASGAAQCVLGNHDLNILLGNQKFDNPWFFGRVFQHNGQTIPQELADDGIRRKVVSFFGRLPLVLERRGLRVVHACWMSDMVDVARRTTDVAHLSEEYRTLIDADNGRRSLDEVDQKLQHQNRNPVKVLTSGLERRVAIPFEASGKLRHLARVPWWEDYADREFCVFGHYSLKSETSIGFNRAICVDYGVGERWKERLAHGEKGPFSAKLAAFQFPELRIVFDDGSTRSFAIPDEAPVRTPRNEEGSAP